MATKVSRIFQKDKVVNLLHNSGIISISSGSVLTIGGLQYILDSTKSVNTVLGNLQRYQVYAVISGGDVTLVISQNENSTGPTGYTSWKLVGCYITTYNGVFGDLIQIDTTKPMLLLNGNKSLPQGFPNSSANFILGWDSVGTGVRYFDSTNSFLRIPLTGTYDVKSQTVIAPATAHTLATAPIGNCVINTVYKTTAPSGPTDFTSGVGNNNIAWGSGTGISASLASIFTMSAGGYMWNMFQSNDTRSGAGIASSILILTLESIPVAIQDL